MTLTWIKEKEKLRKSHNSIIRLYEGKRGESLYRLHKCRGVAVFFNSNFGFQMITNEEKIQCEIAL